MVKLTVVEVEDEVEDMEVLNDVDCEVLEVLMLVDCEVDEVEVLKEVDWDVELVLTDELVDDVLIEVD